MGYPDDAYRFMLTLSDDVIAASASETVPPVAPRPADAVTAP